MAARRKKKRPIDILLSVLAIVLVILILLKFDVVMNAIDPDGKLGLQAIVADAFPVVLGITLIVLGIAAASTVWVGIGLITVGVIIVLSRVYSMLNRNTSTPIDVE